MVPKPTQYVSKLLHITRLIFEGVALLLINITAVILISILTLSISAMLPDCGRVFD